VGHVAVENEGAIRVHEGIISNKPSQVPLDQDACSFLFLLQSSRLDHFFMVLFPRLLDNHHTVDDLLPVHLGCHLDYLLHSVSLIALLDPFGALGGLQFKDPVVHDHLQFVQAMLLDLTLLQFH
jgi:hypothetical protein